MFGKKEKGKKGKDLSYTERLNKLVCLVDNIFKENETILDEMDRHTRQFKGEWWDEKALQDTDSRIFANYLFSTVGTIAPLLTDNKPTWSVIARHPFMQKYFNMFNVALEYLWDKLEMDDKLLQAVTDAFIRKIGVFKISFDPDSEFGGEVRVDCVDPRTFFVAPGYDDVWDAPFCGERKQRSIYWVKERYPDKEVEAESGDGDLSGTESWMGHDSFVTVYEIWMKDNETETIMEEVEEEYEEPYQDEDGNEYTEKKTRKTEKKSERKKYPNGKIVVFTKDCILEEKEYVYEHGKPPYVVFYDYKMPHEFYGMGEAEQIESLNESFNIALQQLDQYMTLFATPNWVVDANSGLDVEAVKNDLPKGNNVWSFNFLTNADPIKQIPTVPINRSILDMISLIPKLIEEISGVTDVSKGMAAKAQRQSATEISSLLESSYTRTRQRVRNLEFSIKRVCYMMVAIMQQFYTETRSVSKKKDDNIEWYDVTSDRNSMQANMEPKQPESEPDPQDPQWQKFMQEKKDYDAFIDIFGDVDTVWAEFDIEIQTSSTLPMDKQSLANMFLKLVELKVIDGEAVINQLRLPRAEEIIERMNQRREEALKAKSGQQAPPRPGPPGMMSQMGGRQ